MSPAIKKLASQDIDQFLALIRLFEKVFEMKDFNMPEPDYLQQLMEKEGFLVFVALVNHEVVGGLTAYTLQQYYSEKPLVYIYDLAVETEHQRKGIGRLLMAGINGYCKDTGAEEVFVQADKEDGHARAFYQATGGRPEKVVHFTYPLNT